MAMEKLPEVNPPSGRVPGQRLLAAPILKRQRRWNREGIGKKGSLFEGFWTRAKYRRKGLPGGPPGVQAPPGCGPTLGRATRAPGPWWIPSGPHLMFSEASDALIFYMISREFFGHFKYWENLKYKNSRKQELATGCTELIG